MSESKFLLGMRLILYMAALGLFNASSHANESVDLSSLFKAMSRETLDGSPPPSAKELWTRLGAGGALKVGDIKWKNVGQLWSSSIDPYVDGSGRVSGAVEIQSVKINGNTDKKDLPVAMVSIELDSSQSCIDPRIYMDKRLKYDVVPASMHDATVFEYVSRSGDRYSSILSSGFAYKDVGCAKKLILKF